MRPVHRPAQHFNHLLRVGGLGPAGAAGDVQAAGGGLNLGLKAVHSIAKLQEVQRFRQHCRGDLVVTPCSEQKHVGLRTGIMPNIGCYPEATCIDDSQS